MHKYAHFEHVLHFSGLTYGRHRVQGVKTGGLQPEFAFHQIVSKTPPFITNSTRLNGDCYRKGYSGTADPSETPITTYDELTWITNSKINVTIGGVSLIATHLVEHCLYLFAAYV